MPVKISGQAALDLRLESKLQKDLSIALDKMGLSWTYPLVDRSLAEGNSVFSDTITIANGFDLNLNLGAMGIPDLEGTPITFGKIFLIAVVSRNANKLVLSGSGWSSVFGPSPAPGIPVLDNGVFFKSAPQGIQLDSSDAHFIFTNNGATPVIFDFVAVGTFDNS